MEKTKLNIGFIGAGTVGTALAVLLDHHGYSVVVVSSRTLASARKLAYQVKGCRVADSNQGVADAADVVFITTPDAVIPEVAASLRWRAGQSVVHCSGADSTSILEPAHRMRAATGSFHPLQTFAAFQQAIRNIPGSTFAIEAEEPLLSTLKNIATEIGGHSIELRDEDRVLYHAAAVITCNYLVTLVKMASDLWQTFSVEPGQATTALLPLLRGTLNNIENVGIPGCLTGPIARGDVGTVEKHLKAIKDAAPHLLEVYQELGRQTIPIALAKGRIDETKARELESSLTMFQRVKTC